MLDCLIVGDSIAVGVGQARPGCTVLAQTGITSGTYLQTIYPTVPRAARQVVISLGVNDDPSMATQDNLRRLRRGLASTQVTWLLPGLKDEVRAAIRQVAAENRDRVVDTISQVGPDRLHPGRDGYRMIAEWSLQGGGPALAAAALRPAVIGMAMRPPGVVGGLPRIQTPTSLPTGRFYPMWPPAATAFAAMPPRDYAYRAFAPSLPRPTLR